MLRGAKDRHIRCGERWNRRPNAHEYKTQTKHERKNLSHLISSFFPKNSNPSLPALCCPSGRRERGLLPAIVLPIPFFLTIVPASITVPVMVMPDPAAISFPITFMPLPMVSPPDTNSRRRKRIRVRGLLEERKRPAAVEAGRS